jgi:cytochrome P450
MGQCLVALEEHPDQRRLLVETPELIPNAIEEVLRWTSPSPSKRRTATVTTELSGHTIAPGDKVVVELSPLDLSRGRITGRR